MVNCGMAAVGNSVLFLGADGKADVFALDGDCSSFPGGGNN